MPKKIKPLLTFEDLKENCFSAHDLCFFMRGYFRKFASDYRNMGISEIKRHIEDLEIAFEFLDKRGFENE